MPKIKDIKSGANNLNFFSPNLANLLSLLSGSMICKEVDYKPKTEAKIPTPRSIKLATLHLTPELATNQKAALIGFIDAQVKKGAQLGFLELSQNIYLAGEFGQAEIEFSRIYEAVKAEFAPVETETEAPVEVEKAERKPRKSKEKELEIE